MRSGWGMRYQLAITGIAGEGSDVDAVAGRLGDLTRQDTEAARRVLQAGRQVVKRNLDLPAARRMAEAIANTGASCSVELMLDAELLRQAASSSSQASVSRVTRAGPRWSLDVGQLKPAILAMPRNVPVKAANGHKLFSVRSRRFALGPFLRLPLAVEITLQVQGAVINAASSAFGSSVLTSALGIASFFGLLYVLIVAARVPRSFELSGARGQGALSLVQHELPWKGRVGYRLKEADGSEAGVIRRDLLRQITEVYGADGRLVHVVEPAANIDGQGEDAAADLAEEFLNAGPYGYLRDLAGWLMGGGSEQWAVRTADGHVVAFAEIGRRLELRTHGEPVEVRRLLAATIVAAGA